MLEDLISWCTCVEDEMQVVDGVYCSVVCVYQGVLALTWGVCVSTLNSHFNSNPRYILSIPLLNHLTHFMSSLLRYTLRLSRHVPRPIPAHPKRTLMSSPAARSEWLVVIPDHEGVLAKRMEVRPYVP